MRSLFTRRVSALLATLSLPAALTVAATSPAFAADAPAAANLPAISETGDQPKPDHWPMKWDLGLGVGYDVFSKNTGLGNSDYLADGSGTRLVKVGDAVAVALRGTAWLFQNLGGIGDLGLELEGKYVPTNLTGINGATGRANIFGVRALAIYKFLDETATVRPFLLAGGGVDIFKSADSTATLAVKKLYVKGTADADSAWILGGGAQWQALHDMGVRLDARFVSTKGLTGHAITGNFEGLLVRLHAGWQTGRQRR